jgi:chromosome partitioning protein
MKAVISVANVAAQTGKTTVAVNLAAETSARGIRTLLVDADPQARATPFFVRPDQIVRTLSDVLLPRTPLEGRHTPGVWDVFSPRGFTHLGVVAGDICLAPFESLELARVTDLRDRLGLISELYDLIILDTPSSLALLTRACLCASTHVIAPVSPNGQGEEGVSLVEQCLGNMPAAPRRSRCGWSVTVSTAATTRRGNSTSGWRRGGAGGCSTPSSTVTIR